MSFLVHPSLTPHDAFTDTSRPALPGEEEKKQYVFVSRQRMERDIQNNQFAEHGYFNGHYYGTSINSIRTIINSGKTCILVLIPQVRIPLYMYSHAYYTYMRCCMHVHVALSIKLLVTCTGVYAYVNMKE